MDPKSIGRSWVGNIYNTFETIFHEVDEFVTKDTTKYFENQVQAVNEGVKKLYSNVQGDKLKNKAQEVAETKDDTTGDSILSMVGVKESSTYIIETQLSEEPVLDSLKQLSLSLGASFSEDTVNGSHQKEGSDAAFSGTAIVVQKDVGVEDNREASHLSDHEDVIPSKLQLHSREQNLLTMNKSPEDLKSSLPLDVSCSQDKRSMFRSDPSSNVIEDAGMRTLGEEKKWNSANPSEDLQTGYTKEQCDYSPTCKNAEMTVEENAVIVENPPCESVGCSEDKSLCQVLCVKENMSTANDLCNPEDNFYPLLSSADEDYKCTGFVKHSPEIVVSDDRISHVSMMKTIDDYAYLSKKVKAKPSLEQDVAALEVSPAMEHPQVDFRSPSNNGSSSDLPFLLAEEHLTTEKPSLMKDESLCKIKLISATDDLKLDGQFSSGTSVRGECFRVLENDEEVPSVRRLSGEAETDLCFDYYHSFMLPELGPEKNSLVQQHTLKEQLRGSEDSCDISVQSKALSIGTEECNSPKYESSSLLSLISLPKQQITTISVKLLSATEDQKTGLRPLHEDDKATYAICNDVMSTCNVPSDQESSNISQLHHVVKSEASSSSLSTELLHANGVEETEEICYDYTHISCSAADSPTVAFVSLSDLGTRGEAGSQIPALSSIYSTASGYFQSLTCLEKHDLAVDTVNADDLLETINLSDEPKLEDICSMVDNELLYTPSFRYRRRFGSYKELIKEAFASRKRLVKEYQQLPIWYGDFDSENSPNPEKHLSPQTAVAEASTSTLTSSHTCDLGESDWELL